MHECPSCGDACCCDEDDIWTDLPPVPCGHVCAGEDEDGCWISSRDEGDLWDTLEDE